MFENYFMILKEEGDKFRAKSAKRITLEEARKKVDSVPSDGLIYISHGLLELLSKSQKDCDPDVSVFEAFV